MRAISSLQSRKLAVAPQNESMGLKSPPVPASLDQPRLYNLDQDIGEQTDVAAQHPEIVTRLKRLAIKMAAELGDGQPGPEVRPPGSVPNPVTLYPTQNQPAKSAASGQPAAGRVLALDSKKIGATLSDAEAPQVVHLPLTITCTVEPAADGVIVAHGGVAVGYALYLKGGHAVFVVRERRDRVTRITSPEPVPEKARLVARLAVDGAMTLTVNHQVVARGKSTGPLASQPKEDFCIGYDSDQRVDDYDGVTLFAGRILGLIVSTLAADPKP